MSSVAAAKEFFLDQITPAVVLTKLRAMAAMLNLRPSLRHHLRDIDPIAGAHAFEATLQFVSWDGRVGAHAVFGGGKMRVHSGPVHNPDLTVRFRGLEQMRRFFAGEDSFTMMLDNDLAFEGNLSYLLKFGHMSAAVSLGSKKVVPTTP